MLASTRTCCPGKVCCPSPPVPLHLGGEPWLPQGPTHRMCTCAPDSREAGEENTPTVSTFALGSSRKSSLGSYRRPSDKNSELEGTGGQWKNLLEAQAGCSSLLKVWLGGGRRPLGDCAWCEAPPAVLLPDQLGGKLEVAAGGSNPPAAGRHPEIDPTC